MLQIAAMMTSEAVATPITRVESVTSSIANVESLSDRIRTLFMKGEADPPSAMEVMNVLKTLFIKADVTHSGRLGRASIIQTIIDFYKIGKVSRSWKKVEAEVDLFIAEHCSDNDGNMRLTEFVNMLTTTGTFCLGFSKSKIGEMEKLLGTAQRDLEVGIKILLKFFKNSETGLIDLSFGHWRTNQLDTKFMSLSDKLQSAGLATQVRTLSRVIRNVMKSATAHGFADWRQNWFEDEANKMRESLKQTAGMKMLTDWLWRMVKGAMSSHLQAWHRSAVEDAMLKDQSRFSGLLLQGEQQLQGLKEKMLAGALKQLRMIFARLMRGAMGMALHAINMHMTEDTSQREHSHFKALHRNQLRSVGLQHMKESMVRIAKGEVALMLERWRNNKKWSQSEESRMMLSALDEHVRILQDRVNDEIRPGEKELACRQVKVALMRKLGRLVAYAFNAMRSNKVLADQQKEKLRMYGTNEDHLKSIAMREMRALMIRLAKGETAMFIEIWRTNKKYGAMQAADALRATLEAEMCAGQMSAALKQLQMVFAGIMRGEKGMALQGMKSSMAEERRLRDMAAMAASSEDQLKSVAIRELRAIMIKLAKGETAMFIEIWRSNLRLTNMMKSAHLAAGIEAEMKAGHLSTALKQLQMIFAGIMRGEKGMALHGMRMTMAEERRAREVAAFQVASEEQLKSAAIREMRAIMTRLAKGEAAMFIEIWRSNKKYAAIQAADALRTSLEAEMKSGQLSAALRMLQMTFAGIMRGEKGMALQGMRSSMAEERRQLDMAAMSSTSEEQLKSAAIRELRAIMTRLAKGETAMFIEIWRSNKKYAAIQGADALKACLEAEMRAGQMGAALKQLQMTFAGIMRGEKGMALQGMKSSMVEDRRQHDMESMSVVSEAQLRSAAVRQLRAIMTRLAKGETAMLIEIWRSNKKYAAIQGADALKARLEAEMRAGQMGAALKQLQLVFAGIMRGEKGMVLQGMKSSMVEDRRQSEVRAMAAAGDAQLKSVAIRELRALMVRLAKGDTAMFIEIWRTNKKLSMASHARAESVEMTSTLRSKACRALKLILFRYMRGLQAMCIQSFKMNVEVTRIEQGAFVYAEKYLINEISLLKRRNKVLMEELVELQLVARSKAAQAAAGKSPAK